MLNSSIQCMPIACVKVHGDKAYFALLIQFTDTVLLSQEEVPWRNVTATGKPTASVHQQPQLKLNGDVYFLFLFLKENQHRRNIKSCIPLRRVCSHPCCVPIIWSSYGNELRRTKTAKLIWNKNDC